MRVLGERVAAVNSIGLLPRRVVPVGKIRKTVHSSVERDWITTCQIEDHLNALQNHRLTRLTASRWLIKIEYPLEMPTHYMREANMASWIPLTTSIGTIASRCSTKTAEISNLAIEHQKTLNACYWLTRPFVAVYFRIIRMIQYIHLYALYLWLAVLWIIRFFFITIFLGATACIALMLLVYLDISYFTANLRDSSKSDDFFSTTNSLEATPLHVDLEYLDTTSNVPESSFPISSWSNTSQTEGLPSASHDLDTDRQQQMNTNTTIIGQLPHNSQQLQFRSESFNSLPNHTPNVDRDSLLGNIVKNLAEFGLRYWAANQSNTKSSSAPGKVYVEGYYRNDGTYVRPHYRSYPSW